MWCTGGVMWCERRMGIWLVLLTIAEVASTVEVHFENKAGGFFLKHSPRQQSVAELTGGGGSETSPPPPPAPLSVLSVDRFTVFQTAQPVSIRATYGPFSTKQTVPARSLVPIDDPPVADARNYTAHGLDVSAHLVRPDIPRDAPVLRVLFHTGGEPTARRLCIMLHATMTNRKALTATCSPDGEDGICLAQLTIPSTWWPPLPPPDKNAKPVKTPQRVVQVAYSVLEPRGEKCVPRVQIQPLTPLATAPLVPARANYKDVRADDILTILLPHAPLYPLSRLHVPVFLFPKTSALIDAFVLRARVKSGLRILSAESSSENWNITVDINPKQKVASVSCVRKDTSDLESQKLPEEIMTWLVEVVEDGEELWDGGRIVWTAQYYVQGRLHHHHHHHHHGKGEEANKKLTARLEIQKDDIQSVLPISKNWEVINTAVLTGHQVSQAMKVLIVSQAGKVADVTLQSSCHSEDESVLKVSSSCSSVYVDGSELRGSSNASILVKYGTYTGLAEFLVWMPEFPLDLSLGDVRLSQIKGWRVPDTADSKHWGVHLHGKPWRNDIEDNSMDGDSGHSNCRLRFQQTPVEVYARFLAEDHDSGRVTYFVNRRTWLCVTDLVSNLLRVSDPRIATLHGKIVQGKSVGRTEIQVLSPITGRVLTAKELRVTTDKVTLTRLSVQVISGLQLSISPDSAVDNGYIAETSVTRKLTAQYQEGLLDVELEWSDGTRTALRDVHVREYWLVVDSLDTETVAFAPMAASVHPRVIAVGEGRGELLRVALLTPEECRKGIKGMTIGPLAQTTAAVEVDFGSKEAINRGADFLQNDGLVSNRDRKVKADLTDILRIHGMPPLKDENNYEPTVQARQFHGTSGVVGSQHLRSHFEMTPLEIGMYVLLAAFCFAIVVFVVSCVVYASRFKPMPPPNGLRECSLVGNEGLDPNHNINSSNGNAPLTTNARDWVWLGRATLERAPPVPVRITENPLGVEQSLPPPPPPRSPNSRTMTSQLTQGVIDTTTFCRSARSREERTPSPTHSQQTTEPPPPPIPPHGTPFPSSKPDALPESQPVSSPAPRRHRHHHHRGKSESHCGSPAARRHHRRRENSSPDPNFVSLPATDDDKGIKRATIIANPTYTKAGLDDLNLGMNYDQMMYYFENLKESNA